jgi:hypothetical protein
LFQIEDHGPQARRRRSSAATRSSTVPLAADQGVQGPGCADRRRARHRQFATALAESIGGEPHKRLRYFASAHHQDCALHPFIIQLERAAGFAHDETPEARLGAASAILMRPLSAPSLRPAMRRLRALTQIGSP